MTVKFGERDFCGMPRRSAGLRTVVTASALFVGLVGAGAPASAGPPVECASWGAGAPMFITEDCVDPRFNNPVIEVHEERTEPVPHLYVNGRFEGTDARFSFYFPTQGQYEGRFFQQTHQFIASEDTSDRNVAFGADSGGYWVQTNGGGDEIARTAEEALSGEFDPAIGGYRVNAAAAKFSREVAVDIYGDHSPYGYLFGGSGGSYQTISAMENSVGVWDGAVPYVMSGPHGMVDDTVRTHAFRILQDVLPQIIDAIAPGGSGNPYAGLSQEQREALEELTRLGFPMEGLPDLSGTGGAFAFVVAPYAQILDPHYIEAFWTVPGYLGHDDPYGSLAESLVQHRTTVVDVLAGPRPAFELASVPGSWTGADLVVLSGEAAGKRFNIGQIDGNSVTLGFGADLESAGLVEPGDEVQIDNSWFLALQTYHRHQVPDDPEQYAWDQFRDSDGDPIYPQRDVRISPEAAFNGAGSLQTGDFNGKMIVLQSILDVNAFPWQADWYRTVVHESGRGDDFRLYFNDNAAHGATVRGASQARLVPYRGALEQALRDVAAWVEYGTPPPAATNYDVVDTQVQLPLRAPQRRGLQPVPHLRVDRAERADITAGELVHFTAQIQVPPGAGQVVDVEWDFDGDGSFEDGELDRIRPGTVNLRVPHIYSEPGTYFPVLRVTSQRDGNTDTPFARVQNLDRVRVVVQ